MKTVTLLIFVLSHAGHWLSGTNTTVQVAWRAQVPVAAATLKWELRFDGVVVSSGRALLPDAKAPINVQIAVPMVRVRTTLQWKYRLSAPGGDAEIEAGSIPIEVYPTDLISDYSRTYARKDVVLVDQGEALARLLTMAKVTFTRVDHLSGLAALRPDVVLVAEGMVSNGPFEQNPLEALARGGAQVLLFRQSRPDTLLGYRLTERAVSTAFVWKIDHPLLMNFDAGDLASWISGDRRELAVELPADAPSLELGYWAAEVKDAPPGPIDALLMTRRIGAGRLVLCQIPMEDWKDDPRQHVFLNNVLNYLSTRPEPTPPPSERKPPAAVLVPELPTIRISPGGQP